MHGAYRKKLNLCFYYLKNFVHIRILKNCLKHLQTAYTKKIPVSIHASWFIFVNTVRNAEKFRLFLRLHIKGIVKFAGKVVKLFFCVSVKMFTDLSEFTERHWGFSQAQISTGWKGFQKLLLLAWKGFQSCLCWHERVSKSRW